MKQVTIRRLRSTYQVRIEGIGTVFQHWRRSECEAYIDAHRREPLTQDVALDLSRPVKYQRYLYL